MSLRHPALVPVLAVLAALGVAWVFVLAPGRSGDGHELLLVTAEATNIIEGTEVREGASTKVGVVDELAFVDGGRAARITLSVDDEAWPLPQGTRVVVRAGGTVSATNRYLELVRPARPAPPLAEGATLPRRDVVTPVEFDDVLRLFDARTRNDLGRFLDTAGAAVLRAEPHVPPAIEHGAHLAQDARLLLDDVGSDLEELDQLVVATHGVASSVRRAEPGLATLLEGAATTFSAIATRADDVEASLQRLPAALGQTRTTLANVEETLTPAGELVASLGPAVGELRRLAPPLNSALRTVREIGPDGRTTIATLRRAAPDLTPLLATLEDQAPRYRSAGLEAARTMRCIRPYAPEIAGFMSTWADFSAGHDGVDRVARVQPQVLVPALTASSPYTAEQATKLFPGLTYAFPLPPGMNAGQPWFQPECGAGPDALDPSKDREATTPSQARP